ncbi:MAG: porin, partial [Gammaproteobacteria bacterium]|nr:porin [Gammaproteobacteria bacterium]
AAAVAATVAPVAAQAQVSVYGRINNAVDIKDIRGEPAAKKSSADGGTTPGVARTAEEFAAFSTANPSTTDHSTVASRFGMRYSGDIGGGMTALARYEFATTTDKEGGGVEDTRIGTVGLQGPFGTINLGNQWSSFYNTVGTHISPTYSLGFYLYSSVAGMPFRGSNIAKYSNNFGPLYVEIDARFNGSKEGIGDSNANVEKIAGDGFGVGISMPFANNMAFAAAFDAEDGDPDTSEDDEARAGWAVKYTGPVTLTLGWTNYTKDNTEVAADDTDITALYLNAAGNFNQQTRWYLGYSTADTAVAAGDMIPDTMAEGNVRAAEADTDDIVDDATQVVMGLYYTLGGGL